MMSATSLSGWSFSPQSKDPLAFLELAYSNLPDAFAGLRSERRSRLAAAARHAAAEAFKSEDRKSARALLWRALGYSPALALDRGVLSTLARAYLTN